MQTPFLQADKLTFERNWQALFAPVSFDLNPGYYLQVQGTNGSGKSTLLRMLAGFIEADSGSIFWKFVPITQQRSHYSQQFIYIGHRNGVFQNLTALENLRLMCSIQGVFHDDNQLSAILEKIKLKNVIAAHMSAGQARRLALARLLLGKAPLWILDEPMTALDLTGQEFLQQLLNSHLNDNGLLVIATHQNLDLAGIKINMELGVPHV